MMIADRLRRATLAATCSSMLLLSGAAAAQTETVVAEGLFREARALMEKGDLEAACAKFAESQRVEASSGTLLNLALCHEKQGKIASAWAEYLAAARLAVSQNRPEREEEAKAKAAALQPRLSYLRVVLEEKVPGIEVKLDDVVLKSSALGSKLPVDPGDRTVTISAPGYKSLTLTAKIGAERDNQTLAVPKLEPEAGAAPPPPGDGKKPPPTSPDTALKPKPEASPPIAGYVALGAGVVALGVGSVFGLMAKSAYDDAESQCPTHSACSTAALDARDKADTRATIANVGVGLGVVGVAAGVVLILTHDSGTEKRTARRSFDVVPYAAEDQAGVAVRGVTF